MNSKIENKYRLWKVLHPNENPCTYCTRAVGEHICVDFLFADSSPDCMKFLEKGNYIVPDKNQYFGKAGKIGDAGIYYAPYIPVITKKIK